MVLGLFAIPGSAAVLVAFAARLLWRLGRREAESAAPRASARAEPIRAG
jgi:hypothetical protein